MSFSETLIQATVNQLKKRLEAGFADVLEIAKGVPDRLNKEWKNFQDEVLEEVDRLDQQSSQSTNPADERTSSSNLEQSQEQIDRLRDKVSKISRKFEMLQ